MYNPLGLGVTLSGMLLDVLVPRPKPRVGPPPEPSFLSGRAGSRTARHRTASAHARAAAGER
jgi:hypothetical protein